MTAVIDNNAEYRTTKMIMTDKIWQEQMIKRDDQFKRKIRRNFTRTFKTSDERERPAFAEGPSKRCLRSRAIQKERDEIKVANKSTIYSKLHVCSSTGKFRLTYRRVTVSLIKKNVQFRVHNKFAGKVENVNEQKRGNQTKTNKIGKSFF